MPYKFNPFLGTLDYYQNVSSTGITGPVSSTDKAITRWNGTSGTIVQDSKAIVQDGGAILTQGIIQKRNIDDDVTVPNNYVWIDQDINVTTGNITLAGDGEITLVD